MNAITINPTERSNQSFHRTYELPARDLNDLLTAPPIACDQLLEQCLDNLGFALTMLDEFEKTSLSRLEEFDAALADRNYAAIESKAHALNGVAGILAANTLMKICSNLESTASDADWNQTHDLIQQLHHEIRRIIDFIPTIRALRYQGSLLPEAF